MTTKYKVAAEGEVDAALIREAEERARRVRAVRVPIELQVAHFMPTSFPLLPVVSEKATALVGDSWRLITETEVVDEHGAKISGLTAFYTEFYRRLSAVDTKGHFESVLVKFSAGQNKIAAKGAILVRIVKFAVRTDFSSKDAVRALYQLGRLHNRMRIRPWMYSVFVTNLLLTIADRLGSKATNLVMEAWVHVFAHIMRAMLPVAIRGLVTNDEVTLNADVLIDKEANVSLFQAAKDRIMDRIVSNISNKSISRQQSSHSFRSGVIGALNRSSFLNNENNGNGIGKFLRTNSGKEIKEIAEGVDHAAAIQQLEIKPTSTKMAIV